MDTATFLHYFRAELLDAEPGLEARLNLAAWMHGPSRPANAPMVTTSRFTAVDQALGQLSNNTAPASLLLTTSDWSSHEWVHFLHGLPATFTTEQLANLDAAFNFTNSGNAEILAAWFPHTLRAGYVPANEAVEKFLRHVGRRKFLVPLYRALLATPDVPARALVIYKEARPNYHSVATGTLDALLAAPPMRG